MRNFILLITIFVTFLGCRKDKLMNDSSKIFYSMDDYNSYLNEFTKKRPLFFKNTNRVEFVFVNNPFGLDSSFTLSIVSQKGLLYNGVYRKIIPIDLSTFRNECAYLSMGILSPQINNRFYLTSFHSEAPVYWDNDKYKYVYVCFITDDTKNTYRIQFFPSERWILE